MAKGIQGSTRPCIAPGCDRMGSKGYGYCGKHYQRWKKHGDPLRVDIGRRKVIGIDLFWTQVDKNGPVPDYAPRLGPCWLWTANLDRDGYGRFFLGGKTRRAHQITYEQIVGPIPAGLVPDHLCRVRHCVNPAHLEWVTNRENAMRGFGPPALNARKSHCIHGHEYTPENTYVSRSGKRQCKACWPSRRENRKARVSPKPAAQRPLPLE